MVAVFQQKKGAQGYMESGKDVACFSKERTGYRCCFICQNLKKLFIRFRNQMKQRQKKRANLPETLFNQTHRHGSRKTGVSVQCSKLICIIIPLQYQIFHRHSRYDRKLARSSISLSNFINFQGSEETKKSPVRLIDLLYSY